MTKEKTEFYPYTGGNIFINKMTEETEVALFNVNHGDSNANHVNDGCGNHFKENGNRPKEGEDDVSYRDTRGRIVISRGFCWCTIVTILIAIVTVGLLAGLVGKSQNCEFRENTKDTNSTSSSPSEEELIDSSLPWGGIRLPQTLIPEFYNVTIRVDLEKFIYTGKVEISVRVNSSTQYVIIHSTQLKIDKNSIRIWGDGSIGSIRIMEQFEVATRQFYVIKLEQQLLVGNRYQIAFEKFEGILQTDLRGLYRSSYTDNNGSIKYLAASQLQPIDTRKVFPCFDEPALKAKFSVTLEHRPGYVALSNMPQITKTILTDDWEQQVFQTTPLMSTYLLAFVVADFDYRETVIDGLKIRVWSSKKHFYQTEHALHVASQLYPYFTEFFGIPEIVPKTDHVAIPDFSAGAMENWGLVLYRESAILYDEEISPLTSKFLITIVVSHEVAHTWFGNMVTMKWWDDLWLNEGFASTLMYFATDHLYPEWRVFDLTVVEDILTVMTKDALLTSHPVSSPINNPFDIPQIFDEISYNKGLAVLRLLQGFLGVDKFKEGLRKYVQQYKFKNTEMFQLWQVFSEVTGHKYDVQEIMNTWTKQMGFPVITVKAQGGGKFLLEQSRFLLNPEDISDPSTSPYGYKWDIPFTYTTPTNKHSASTVWLSRDSAQISVGQEQWIVGNINKTGFFVVNYETDMWEVIVQQLQTDHTVFSRSTRTGLISDSFLLARSGRLNYAVAFELTKYLKNDRDYEPWKAFDFSLEYLEAIMSTTDYYGLFLTYLRGMVASVHREIGTSTAGTLPEMNLKSLILKYACHAGVPDAVAYAKTFFQSWMKYNTSPTRDGIDRVPADYSLIIYSMGIREGGQKEWDFLWKKYQESSVPAEKEVMLNALAQTRQPWLLWRYIRRTFDASQVRFQDTALVFKFITMTPLGRNIALQFMKDHWKEINQHFGLDAYLLREIIFKITERVSSEYELRQLENLYRKQPPMGVASRDAQNGLALIRSNIRWQRENLHDIGTWLKEHLGV